jgi:hypothetical protein
MNSHLECDRMNHPSQPDPSGAPGHTGDAAPGAGKLAAVLAFFFVAGGAMALVVWSALNEFTAGRSVTGGSYLLAMVFIGGFAGLAWILGRFIKNSFPSSHS